MIWKNDTINLQYLNTLSKHTLLSHLSITFIEIGDNYLKASMPVDKRTIQPMGLLHGGASVALSESLASIAGYMMIDTELYDCVGIEVSANHIRSVKEGNVIGTTSPIHIGKKTQLWETRITTNDDRLICISKVTLMNIAKENKATL